MTIRVSAAVAAAPRRAAGGLVAGIIASVRRRLSVRRTRAVLGGLPDDILKDIGVVRCGIDHVAALPAERDRHG